MVTRNNIQCIIQGGQQKPKSNAGIKLKKGDMLQVEFDLGGNLNLV
jgi:hypothetical protein